MIILNSHICRKQVSNIEISRFDPPASLTKRYPLASACSRIRALPLVMELVFFWARRQSRLSDGVV